MTAVIGLGNGTIGQRIVLPWIEDGSILDLGPKVLRPYYQQRGLAAAQWMRECFDAAGADWAMHVSEGAFFHWLWLPSLAIPTRRLYERLKARHVLTVPGEYFFYGHAGDDPHQHQCLRINFSRPEAVVRQGLGIIAEQAARAQSGAESRRA
jgi:valine--pyruvate aminotransferase